MKASDLATLVGGQLVGPDTEFHGVAPLEHADSDQASYAQRPPSVPVQAAVVLAKRAIDDCSTVVVPDRELVLVHLGKTPEEAAPAMDALLLDLVRSC